MFDKNNAALTPPMGWNSWDCYAAGVNEEQLLGNAEYMAAHMKEYGWEYVVCDIQWSDPLAGTTPAEYIPLTTLCLDEYGRQMPAPERFPSAADGAGFKPIADRIHAMGLKFGLHILRGVPRQAAHAHLPVEGLEGVTCDKIADPFSICPWNSDMYGILPTPEGQAYYDSIFRLYASWDVDYVKVDDICNLKARPDAPYAARHEIEMIAKAISRCGRPMVLSLSPGPALIEESWHLSEYANMWRMTDDFWDGWPQLRDMFRRCEIWQAHVRPGCWPDCDMLPLGRIGMG
ncbi:MAG: glycoside hydrolase family 27 protein, partial [Eubacteriales bacterium]|nr:glycoside hydrolase family 27 protein [Eubacteriales bacterium]